MPAVLVTLLQVMTQRHVSLPVFHFYQKFLQSGLLPTIFSIIYIHVDKVLPRRLIFYKGLHFAV